MMMACKWNCLKICLCLSYDLNLFLLANISFNAWTCVHIYIYVYAYIYICSKLVWQRRDDYDSKCQVINPQLVQCVFFIQTCRWTITLHFLHLQRCASFCFCFPYVKCNLLLIVPLFPGLKLIDTSNQLGCFVLWIQVYICNHIYIYIFVPNCYVYFTCMFELRNTYCMWPTCVYLLRFRALGDKSPLLSRDPVDISRWPWQLAVSGKRVLCVGNSPAEVCIVVWLGVRLRMFFKPANLADSTIK